MKRVLWLVPAILLVCVTSQAQGTPQWDIYGGYSYVRANLGGTAFNLNGGGAAATENFNDWVGGRLEFNAFAGTVEGTNVNIQTITYGPVFTYRKFDRITPFAHVQIGAVHADTGFLGISQPAFKFAMTAGGGADYNLNEHLAVRFQGDYLMTRFLNERQDNIVLTGGLVFRIGNK
jgi:opacity protein-like surface antigen